MRTFRARFRRLTSIGSAAVLLTAVFAGSFAFLGVNEAAAGGTITQVAPFSNSTTVVAGNPFSDQLATTGNIGPATFITNSAVAQPITVSSSGAVVATAGVEPGTYFLFGTDSDSISDTGTWNYTFTVTPPGTITQTAPTSGSVSAGTPFTDQLATTPNTGAVTFTVTSSSPAFAVSSSGAVSAADTLTPGLYIVSGTDTDFFGDAGIWSFALTENPAGGTIAQTAPTSGSVSAGNPFTSQLLTSGNNGAVTFTVTSSSPAFTVSGSGAVSAPDTLIVGSYTVSGTDTDAFGNTGHWSFALTETPAGGTITQTAPTSGSVSAGNPFTSQLLTSGNNGAVTFTVTSSSPAFTVSSSGAVSAPDTLIVGSYTVSGTDTDAFGNTGHWSFTLHETPAGGTITQTAPTSGSVSAGNPFTSQLNTSGNNGAVTFTVTSSSPAFTVSGSGSVSAPDTLIVGSYTVSGTDTDAFGNTGSWSFTLHETPAGGTITQTAPTSGSVSAGNPFTSQLLTSGNNGAVTFTVTSSSPAFAVSSSGVVSAPDTLIPGSYTVSGTDTDAFGNTGSWSFALTENPAGGTITQTAPTSGSVSAGSPFTSQLNTSGNNGAVTFTVTSSSPAFAVSSSGAVSAADTLTPGLYIVSGTDADAFGNTGIWSFALTENPAGGTITQTAPTSGSVSAGSPFTSQLNTSGNNGAVTFTVTSSSPAFTVSGSGAVSAPDTLIVGSYTVSGTDTDAFGNTGHWSFALTENPAGGTITQTAPTSGSVSAGSPFTSQLNTSGNNGAVTFTVTSSSPAFTVSGSGAVSAPDTLIVGSYTVSGTDTDAFGNTGHWSFTLHETPAGGTITQTAPTSGSVSAGSPFTSQLNTSGNNGAVTFTVTSSSPAFTVSGSGSVSAPDTLIVGSYTVSGTDTDAFGNTGHWSFTLHETPAGGTITQTAPTSGSVSAGNPFTSQLLTSGNNGAVTFTVTSSSPAFTVSGSGGVSAPDALIPGSYTVSGTDTDAFGNTGHWSFTLTETPAGGTITQTAPTSGSVSAGNPFTSQLLTSGNNGAVTFTVTSSSPAFTVSGSGAVSAPDTLIVGSYTVSGTDTDAFGNTGHWSFTLTETPAGGTITQTAPTSGSVSAGNPFTSQLLTSGNNGAVTFTVTTVSPAFTVSSSGAVSAPDTLAVGPYTVQGTDVDNLGNTGTWTYTLTVNVAPSSGYTLVASDGGIFAFGDATFFGSTGALTLNKPIVGMAATPDGKGYWLVASDGGLFAFGDAKFFGSTGALTLNKPIVGMAATSDGKGYWLVASDGGIFAFGDAKFFGSTGALTLNKPIVGMAATSDGKGYWLVASDGGIFNFGDAKFFGSTGALTLNKPIVGMAATSDGKGYWLVASDGGIFAFGDAKFFGSTGALTLNKPIVGMAATSDGKGYWLVASDGGIFNFGDAKFFGSTGALTLNKPIVGMAP